MKLTFRIMLVLAFLFSLFTYQFAGAQTGLDYTSGVNVVNLESTDIAVTLIYYNTDGSEAGRISDDTITANSSKVYFPLTGISDGFQGSMVITSEGRIAATADLFTTDSSYYASTTGFSSGSTEFYLPLLMCSNSGFDSFFSVQNAGGSTANITVNYLPASHGASGVSETAAIEPGASKYFDQKIGSTTKNCTDLSGTDGKFIGSAKITSNQPVVAVLMMVNTTNWPILLGYNGFPFGSESISFPLIMANNNSFYTSMQIQNVGDTQTTITVDYSPNTVSSNEASNDTCVLDPNESCTLIQNDAPPANGGVNDWDVIGRYIGGAMVTSSPSQPLVAIVNQQSPGIESGVDGPYGTSAEGFNIDPAVVTSNIAVPIITANNAGFYTSLQILNVGTETCASVTIDYGPNTISSGNNPTDYTFSLDSGNSKTVIQNAAPPANGGINNWDTIGQYVGSARIIAPGCKIRAIVNQQNFSTGDKLMTYNGINY